MKHPHAELMIQYAQDAMETDEPWKRWEYINPACGWETCTLPIVWCVSIQYRRKQVDPYAELKAAAKDPSKQIRVKYDDGSWTVWESSGYPWIWGASPDQYEIRDNPKAKKVKLLAVYFDHELRWLSENVVFCPTWKRVPSEDKEIEIES